MLKRLAILSSQHGCQKVDPLKLLTIATQRMRGKQTGNMTDYDSAVPSDLVNMSKELDIEDALDREARRNSRGGRGRGRNSGGWGGRAGGAGGRAGGEMNRKVAISKALSKLLRHAAGDVGVTLDGEGFARLDQVVCISISFPDANDHFLKPKY
jgi:2'-phosphotransferase